MPRVCLLEIEHFRGISSLKWKPAPGINCLIGSGDSGKSSVLDALELVLSPRRALTFSDTDFYRLNPEQPFSIQVTVSDLTPELMDLDRYGHFLRGWNPNTGEIIDEPDEGLEIALTLRLQVGPSLEGEWSLVTSRGAEGVLRDLQYKDRLVLVPVRLGDDVASHLSWGRNSVLNRLSEDQPPLKGALVDAARAARNAFGTAGAASLSGTLELVREVAEEVGVPVGAQVLPLLDVYGISLSTAGIGLHDSDRVPLRCLGTGSARLLAAGLQRRAATSRSIVLVDEVELGLEPHRIARLLTVLGARDAKPPMQVFMTTHSPVVLRELKSTSVHIVRRTATGEQLIHCPGDEEEAQKALRACAEAFLSPAVVVCEGKTEVGLLRGLDHYWSSNGYTSFATCGVMPADGESTDRAAARALVFAALGYRTAIFRDSDRALPERIVRRLTALRVKDIAWPDNCSTEEQLFRDCPRRSLRVLVEIAVEYKGADSVDAAIRARSAGAFTLSSILQAPDAAARSCLATAAKEGKWYKLIEPAERVGVEVVGPMLDEFAPGFRRTIGVLRSWIDSA